MSNQDFVAALLASKDLTLDCFNDSEFCVLYPRLGLRTVVAMTDVGDHSWREFDALFHGAREAEVMRKTARITGYFSNLRGWNRSKLAELRDRHRGVYTLPEVRDARQHA